MKYIVFLTTNIKAQVNGADRILIGVHKTEDPSVFDGYIGDGVKVLQASTFMYPKTPFLIAVKKYGVESFRRTILYIYDNIKEAYDKAAEIVNKDLINLSHTYNYCYITRPRKLYQFNLSGELVKVWENIDEASDFYGYPTDRWKGFIRNKSKFLNYYWSYSDKIDVTEYHNVHPKHIIYLYNEDGKLVKEFNSQLECAKYFNCEYSELTKVIRDFLMYRGFYVSNALRDIYKPRIRSNYIRQIFYVYKESGEFVGTYKGKEVMNVIKCHSWRKINNVITLYNGWYENFYISLEPVTIFKEKKNRSHIEVFTKYGEYLETLDSLKKVKDKYGVTNAQLRDIQQGNKYCGDYIIKYNSK